MEARWMEIAKHVDVTNHEMGVVQTEVGDLKDQFSVFRGKVDAMSTDVTSLKADVSYLKASHDKVATDIDKAKGFIIATAVSIIGALIGWGLFEIVQLVRGGVP
jgi:outer membrane murein-binding lipoprotein Lpp